MDLTTLEQRIKRSDSNAPSRFIHEYKCFLVLKTQLQDTDAKFLSASPLIDECWHQHILDTRAYQQFLRDIDMDIHHDPDGGEDEAAREKRRTMMLAAYELHFGEKPPLDIWNMKGEEPARHGGRPTNWKVSMILSSSTPPRPNVFSVETR
ncbi:hypothetical protein HDV00_001472 [Rhizophlyctis rosea]|nr:hypothetical protein HDV00_001472 [Rhizophlyctis rosea]